MKGRAWMLFWPGLAGLWLRGHWLGLAGAVGFAAAVNLALLTTFVWPRLVSRDLPPWSVPLAAWVLVLWLWIVGWKGAGRILAREAAKSLQPDAVSDALLCEAQTEYLRGHWLEAESLLTRLLVRRPGDAEARLLLASVYRRSGHTEKARQQLAELSQLQAAAVWRDEIACEVQKLSQLRTVSDNGREQELEPGTPNQRAA
jgi:hypothetical protein